MPFTTHRISKPTIYPPANECIYCGAKGVPLTDEHTIPDGMGGRHILPKSCCKACQKTINEEFEQHVLRTVFSNIRAVFGIKARRKRKPVRHSIKIVTHSGETKRIYMDPKDLPKVFALPMFPQPFFFTGQQPSASFRGGVWKWADRPFDVLLKELDARAVIPEPAVMRKFGRFIAKMAHSHAWALYGPVFEPLLPAIILGQNKLFIEYIGGEMDPREAEPMGYLSFKCWIKPGTVDRYLVARVRPFAFLAGSPVYYAIIGAIKSWPLPKHEV